MDIGSNTILTDPKQAATNHNHYPQHYPQHYPHVLDEPDPHDYDKKQNIITTPRNPGEHTMNKDKTINAKDSSTGDHSQYPKENNEIVNERLNNTNPVTATLPKPNRPVTTTIANQNLDNLHNLDHDQLLEIATQALTTIANTRQEPRIINYDNIHIWNDPHNWTTLSYEDGRLYYRGEHYTPEQARELIRILTTATERAEHAQGYND